VSGFVADGFELILFDARFSRSLAQFARAPKLDPFSKAGVASPNQTPNPWK
jgi:hypothetical protein